MLQENTNYGKFSDIAYYGGLYDKMTLLESPSDVSKDGFLAFASAMWEYMTPVSPKPSMHEIMTGFYVPSYDDTLNNIIADFGATINVISDGSECLTATSVETAAASARSSYYTSFCSVLSVTPTGTSCDTMQAFSTTSSSYFPKYWF